MDNNNWRPAQEPNTMDGADWRTQLQPDSRQRIVNKIMETLKRYLPISGPDGLIELRKIASRFEEKIYSAATSQLDYQRKISLKMLSMETKSQNPSPNVVVGNQNLPEAGQQPPIPLPSQSQIREQLLSPNRYLYQQQQLQQQQQMMYQQQQLQQQIMKQRNIQWQQPPIRPSQSQIRDQLLSQQQQLQQQMMNHHIQSSHIPSHIQQQQNLLQSIQMQSSQQYHVPSSVQSSQPTLQQTESSMTQSSSVQSSEPTDKPTIWYTYARRKKALGQQ